MSILLKILENIKRKIEMQELKNVLLKFYIYKINTEENLNIFHPPGLYPTP